MNPVPANQLIPGTQYLIEGPPKTLANGTVCSGKKIGIFHHYDDVFGRLQFIELRNVPWDARPSGLGNVPIKSYPETYIFTKYNPAGYERDAPGPPIGGRRRSRRSRRSRRTRRSRRSRK